MSVRKAKGGFRRKYVINASPSKQMHEPNSLNKTLDEIIHKNNEDEELNEPASLRVVERKDDSLKRIFELEEWLNSYHGEQEIFHSFAVFSEVRLREAFNVTQQVGLPSPQRTAVCCEILCKMAKIFGRFNGIVTLIAYEMMRSTYYGFDKTCIFDIETSDGRPLKPYRDLPKGVTLEVQPERLMHWTPYFTLVKNLQSEIKLCKKELGVMASAGKTAGQMQEKRMRVMDKAVSSWQHQGMLNV